MKRRNKFSIGLSLILIGIFITGCGPSPEEQQATAAAQTAAAATNTPRPTSTPSPTKTSSPTPAPTPTPTPDPDPMTMIDLNALNLPDSFVVRSPDDWGIERGAVGIGTGNSTFLIENSFVFANDSRFELISGYTSQLSGSSDIKEADEFLSNFVYWSEVAYSSSGVTITTIEPISGSEFVGDKSAGVRIEYIANSNSIVLEQVMFRVGDILATVNVKNFQETTSTVSVVDLAEVYARNINYPIITCEITKITTLDDMPWPTFDFQAAGFYPYESVLVLVEGEVEIGGEQYVVAHIDGLGDEMASVRVLEQQIPFNDFELFGYSMVPHNVDQKGILHDTIMQTGVEAEDVVLSKEHKITVYGLYSGCVVSQEAIWEPVE